MVNSKIKELILILTIGTLITLITYIPIIKDFNNWGINDWDSAFTWIAIGRDSLVKYFQFPLWTPYIEGGRPFYLNPEHIFYYPIFYFVFPWMKVIYAYKVFFLLHILIAFITSYYFAKSSRLTITSSLLVAILYAFNSSMALNFAQGHIYYLGYSWIPLLLMAVFNITEPKESVFLATFASSMLILASSTYIVIITFLFLLISCFFLIFQKNTRPLKILFTSLTMTFFITLFKTIPEVFFMSDLPRTIDLPSGHSIFSLIYSFISKSQNIFWEHDNFNFYKSISNISVLNGKAPYWLFGISEEWPDNGSYIGLFPLIASIVAMVNFRKSWKVILWTMLFFIMASFGARLYISPWSLLKHFPLLESMRSLMRFKIITIPFICLFCGFFINSLRLKLKFKYRNIFFALILLFITFDLTLLNQKIMSRAFPFKEVETTKQLTFPALINSYNPKDYDTYSQTTESLIYPKYLEGYSVTEKAEDRTNRRVIHSLPIDDQDYKGHFYLKESRGNLKLLQWSPNQLTFEYDVNGSDSIILNQNYDENWVATNERNVTQYRGIISIPIAKKGNITISYTPKRLYILMIISTLSLFFIGIIFYKMDFLFIKIGKGQKYFSA